MRDTAGSGRSHSVWSSRDTVEARGAASPPVPSLRRGKAPLPMLLSPPHMRACAGARLERH